MVKALIILILAAAVFGGAYHFVDKLYLAPVRELKAEKERGPEPPPPDPALPEFLACVEVQKRGDVLAARTAFERFLDQYPHSSKVDAARDLLGEINADILLSQKAAPEKMIYIVQPGDVLTRVAMRTKSTPELLMRSNNLAAIMLRIGQKLVVTPADFSIFISMKDKRVRLFNGKRYFKQYHILAQPAAKKGVAPAKLTGRVVDKIALDAAGTRVTFVDKGYAGATHKISFSIPGHSLYGVAPGTPANGIGLDPPDVQEIAVLLSKNDPVTIE